MPVYEYKCEACGSEFEATQGMDDAPLSECKECSGPVHRLISFTSFTLKGSGWYSDGYANASSDKKNGSKPNGNGSKGKTGNGKEKTGNGKVEKSDSSSASSTATTLGKD